jgi:N utilization substance protein B
LGQRSRGRKFLLQCRYAADANGLPLEDNMEAMGISERISDPQTRIWLRELGKAAGTNRGEIDRMIAGVLENWSMDRLTPITRLILQQAVAESLHMNIPPAVAVKEAVKLAIEFEGPGTGSFVNGVLDKILFRSE